MSAGKLQIRSRKLNQLLWFNNDVSDLAGTVEYHKFYLLKRIHPNPMLMSHITTFGLDDLEFLIDPVEKAVIEVHAEKRGRKRIGQT